MSFLNANFPDRKQWYAGFQSSAKGLLGNIVRRANFLGDANDKFEFVVNWSFEIPMV